MDNMTLEEALAAADVSTTPVNDILMVDAEARTIIVPASEMLFGVRQDMDAERKHFKCQKIVGDNVDLSNCHIYISYVPSKQDGTYDINEDVGAYLCEDLDVDGDYVTFSWKLSGNVFVKAGYIAFAVYAKQADADGNLQTKWHTTFAIGKVLDTLPDGEQIVEKYADVIEQLLNRMDEVEAIATPEAMQNYVEAYLAENPPSGMTADEKAQLQKNTEDISSLSEEIANKTGTGLSTEAIDKLEEVGNYLAYTTADGGSKWTELISILRNGSSGGGSGETVTLQSISATYTGGDVAVGTALTDLTGITVTAHYSDGSTATITDYTLSGTIAEGSNTITVSYGGKTTTFTVTGVVETPEILYQLPSATVFDGTNNIDTGVSLLSTDSDWTIVADLESQETGSEEWAFHTINRNSPWEQFGLARTTAKVWRLNFGTTQQHQLTSLGSTCPNIKIAITHATGNNYVDIKAIDKDGNYSGVYSGQCIYGSSPVFDGNIVIGSHMENKNYWKGVANDFKIYSKVLSDDEISAYLV